MKLRYLLHILIILVLLLIDDGIYNLRQYSQEELSSRAEQTYLEIEEKPAILIVTEEKSERISDDLSNLYFVNKVSKQNKSEIIDILSRQYQLDEASSLLDELNLPAVLEIQFRGDAFSETESSLFWQATEKEEGIFQIIYSDENYLDDWSKLDKLLEYSGLIENYWQWIYWGLAIIILLTVLSFRLSYENRQEKYWQVFTRSGGKPALSKIFRILNSIFLVFIPLAIAMGLEYFLWINHTFGYMPDFRFHIIRSAALVIVSLLSLFLIRRRDYD